MGGRTAACVAGVNRIAAATVADATARLKPWEKAMEVDYPTAHVTACPARPAACFTRVMARARAHSAETWVQVYFGR